MRQLLYEIGSEKENKTIIFVETKRKVDSITQILQLDGWPALSIHGDKNQQERDHVLYRKNIFFCIKYFLKINYHFNGIKFLFLEFRNGHASILVATDVAARGLGQ